MVPILKRIMVMRLAQTRLDGGWYVRAGETADEKG